MLYSKAGDRLKRLGQLFKRFVAHFKSGADLPNREGEQETVEEREKRLRRLVTEDLQELRKELGV